MADWSSNPFVNALSLGWRWASSTINYFFDNGPTTWLESEKAALRDAFESWSNVANLTFQEVFNSSTASLVERIVDDPGAPGSLGSHSVFVQYSSPDIIPVSNSSQLSGRYNRSGFGWDETDPNGGLEPGGLGFLTAVHEIGHALGLDHTHRTTFDARFPPDPHWFPGVDGNEQTDSGDNGLNQDVYSVMSYVNGLTSKPISGGAGQDNYGYVAGPGAFDIAAIQFLYGANSSFANGSNSYVLTDVNGLGTYWTTIWDTGGTDQIVYTGSADATFDLRAATLQNAPGGGGFQSSVIGIRGGFIVANGVLIENASGGAGNDTLIGNSAANRLTGGAGADRFTGGPGDDRFILGPGNGADVITDFVAGPGSEDKVDLSAFSRFRTFDDVQAATVQDGSDTMINFGNGDVVRLRNVARADLSADDFVVVDRGAFPGGVLWRHEDGTVSVWEIMGDDFRSAVLRSASEEWQIRGTGDFDGDRDSDILWQNTAGNVVIWQLENGVFVGSSSLHPGVSPEWQIRGTGDFDGDGDSDILWRHEDGRVSIWAMDGNNFDGSVLRHVSPEWTINGVGDFNNDGDDGVLWRHADGTVVTWELENASFVGGNTLGIGVSQLWRIQETGDFNRDGNDDILWLHEDGTVSIWELAGSSFDGRVQRGVSNDWQIEGTRDFDADGDSDILWRDGDGTVATWEMEAGQFVDGTTIRVVEPEWQIADTGDFFLA